MQRRIAEGNHTLFAAFAGDANQFVLKIYVAQIEFGEFGDAHDRAVEEF